MFFHDYLLACEISTVKTQPLKVMEREAFSKFYDAITTNCLIPIITFPTRFSTLNGSIVDNILCKLSEVSLTSTSGIIIDQFSDHLPCFITLFYKSGLNEPKTQLH